MNEYIRGRKEYEGAPYEAALLALIEFCKTSESLVELGFYKPEEAPAIEALGRIAEAYGLFYDEVLDDIEELKRR